jgi:hypothetical protein
MRSAKALVLFALVCLASPSYAAMTGTWSGTFTATLPCLYKPGQSVTFAGPVTLFISDSPANNGTFNSTATAFAAFPDNLVCQARGADSLPLQFAGTVAADGAISNAFILTPGIGAFRPTGSQKGDTFAVSGPGDNGGSITLSAVRTDSDDPPKSRLTGRYVGTYSFSADFSYRCSDVGAVTASGPLQISLFDIGRGVSGSVMFTSFRTAGPTRSTGQCFQEAQATTFSQLLGTLTAGTDSTITGFIGVNLDQAPFTGTFDLRSFKGTARTPGGGKLEFDLVNQDPVIPPDIRFFDAEQTPIVKGEATRLRWKVNFANKVTIDNGIGDQPPSGSIVIRPDQTTLYTLTASGRDNTSGRRTFTVSVLNNPNVQLGSFPRAILQRPNEGGGTDSFTLINRGFVTSDVTLTMTDDFYTIDTPSFSIPAGTARTVTLTGRARPLGSYRGSIIVQASGGNPPIPEVRVFMVVASTPPGGKLESTTARVEVSSTQGQNAAGTVAFRNVGTAPVIGVVTASAPFIIPQAGIVTIPAGQTVNVNYTIDARQRPIDNPLGALSGTISLRFPGAAAGPAALQAAPSGSTSVNVTLVHVASPLTGPGIPAPLNPGELAIFAPGLSNKATAIGDLLLGNKQAIPLQQFALFVAGSTGSTSAASIPQLSANSSVELPGLLKNVTSSDVPSGTAQIRGVDAAKVSVGAVQSNTSLPIGTFSTALPTFRSDRSVTASRSVVLTGLQKGDSTQTSLFVQEMSGNGGTFTVELLDQAGRVVSSRPAQTIGAFGFAELADVVPANAMSTRVVNSSSSTATIGSYALVTNAATGDAWLVTDPSAGPSTDSAFIIPVIRAGSNAETVLYATNRSTTSVTVDVQGASAPPLPNRKRAARSGGTSANLVAETNETLSIAPLETKTMKIAATSGYVRVSGPSGSISAVGRSTVASGASIFGTGLPAVPITAALAAGQGRRFSAVDDAGDESRATAAPATFRTSMQLVEAAGASTTVRLTLQFGVATGSKVTSTARVTKEYSLGANGSLMITDVAQDIIGASRPSIGDIRNATLDVDVVGGSGKVIPFLASFDNGSGDLIVRTE